MSSKMEIRETTTIGESLTKKIKEISSQKEKEDNKENGK